MEGRQKNHCTLCDVDIYSMYHHLKTNKHKRLSDPEYIPTQRQRKKYNCTSCNVSVYNIRIHEKTRKHQSNSFHCQFSECKEALNGLIKAYCYDKITILDPLQFLFNMTKIIEKRIQEQKWKNVRLQLCLLVKFSKTLPDGHENIIEEWFNSGKMTPITNLSLLDENLQIMINTIGDKIDRFTKEGSGWIINGLTKLEIKLAHYEPLRASSYLELPSKYRNPDYKLINIQNQDQQCFKWCVARSNCLDQKNPQRVSTRLKEEAEKYNWDGIEFPVQLNQISKFEDQNTVSVSVYSFDEKLDLYPLRITKVKKEKNVNLVMIRNDANMHYVLMKDLSPFINSKHNGKKHICSYCLHSFYKKELLDAHEPSCSIHTPVRMELAEGPVKFKNHFKEVKHPFVIYADFESTLKKIITCQPNPEESYINNINMHVPNSFCCYTKCEVDIHSKLESYQGPDSQKKFVEYLISEVNRIYNIMKVNKQMNMSREEKDAYYKAKICYVCNSSFTDKNYKVRDHNHLTGEYRGAAHLMCNLKIRNPSFIPVFMHNLSGYDAHLFVKELGNIEGKLNIIPQTDEKYISISQSLKVDEYTNKKGETKPIYRELRFLDSFRFMSSSLDKLSSNLTDKQLNNLKKFYPETEKYNLVKRKGVYPYEWVDHEDKFMYDRLPSKNCFYSKLRVDGISEEDYIHANRVWKAFNCKIFKDYHMLYLQTDVLLLADVFENFRVTCIDTYNLDPAHYYTAPGLSWDALLKHTKIELDLIQDLDMLLFIEKGIRGGISTITHRYAKANNPYIPETYDPKKPNSYITYQDANNLYGWAMSLTLPTGKFKWLKESKCSNFDVDLIADDAKKGYILEVDLEYPNKLHNDHNDYPLAVENIEINKVHKLTPNLNNKTKYIIYYRNLKQCLDLGLKLTKIHRILEFDQRPWMKPYIDLNTEKRKQAENPFEVDFFKLMNNAVFGKCLENIRGRVDVQLVKNSDQAQKLINKPNFKSYKIFSDNLIACHMEKTKLKFDKPIYVGMVILDMSKYLMYDFHYNHIKPKYKNKAKLLFTDTDSLCYHIQSKDYYRDMKRKSKFFDTSNFPKDHFLYSDTNKKVMGKMKDETGGVPIKEFVGLRSKLYAYTTANIIEKRAKGISKNVVAKAIQFEDYRRALFEKEVIRRSMITINSTKHIVYSSEINKIALCGKDDKRYILENNIDTLAHGHYKIKS